MRLNLKTDRPTILLMWSGGLDSTGVLWKLLNDDIYSLFNIHAHHISLWNHEGRSTPEGFAIDQILSELDLVQKCNLSYTDSLIEFPTINGIFPYDADVVAFVAAQICNALPNIRYVANGVTRDDYSESSDYSLRIGRSYSVFNSACTRRVEQIRPVSDMTKADIWTMLPDAIREATWSCRVPRAGEPCGECKSCIQRFNLGRK